MKGGRKVKVGRWLLIAAGAVLLYFFLSGPEGFINLYRSHRELSGARAEIGRLHQTIDSLVVEVERLRTDTAYIEKMAREKLGMAAKDETVYKFIDKKD